MPGTSWCGRTVSESPACASTRSRAAGCGSASCSRSMRATAWPDRRQPQLFGPRGRSLRIVRRPARWASSRSTAASRCCAIRPETAARCDARSPRRLAWPTERESTTRSSGRWRSCATRRSRPARSSCSRTARTSAAGTRSTRPSPPPRSSACACSPSAFAPAHSTRRRCARSRIKLERRMPRLVRPRSWRRSTRRSAISWPGNTSSGIGLSRVPLRKSRSTFGSPAWAEPPRATWRRRRHCCLRTTDPSCRGSCSREARRC